MHLDSSQTQFGGDTPGRSSNPWSLPFTAVQILIVCAFGLLMTVLFLFAYLIVRLITLVRMCTFFSISSE